MNEEHKNLQSQKKTQQQKAIFISMLTVFVVVLLVLAAILFLPDKVDGANSEVSEMNNNTSIPDAVSKSEEIVLGVESTVSLDESSNNDTSIHDTSTSDISDDTSNTEELFHGWVINNLGYTYIYGTAGYEQCSATGGSATRYADTLNALVASLPESVNVYSILAPTSVEFAEIPYNVYKSDADNFINANQSNVINVINEKLNSRIKAVNIYDTLSSHKEEYLYFRTDINWTALAAYYAYYDFATATGISPVSLNDFTKETYDGFLGRFYTATGKECLSDTPDSIEYYLTDKNNTCDLTVFKSGVTYTSYAVTGNGVSGSSNGYNVFLGMEAERYTIKTGVSGKKILLVSDTSAAPFVPYLVSHYSEIHYVNPNYFNEDLAAYVSEQGINEVLFLSYVTNANREFYTNVLKELNGVSE